MLEIVMWPFSRRIALTSFNNRCRGDESRSHRMLTTCLQFWARILLSFIIFLFSRRLMIHTYHEDIRLQANDREFN